MAQYLNDADLNAAILRDLASIIDEVATYLVLQVQQLIEEYVYDPFDPRDYQRQGYNGGFVGSWTKTTTPTVKMNTVSTEIFSDVNAMTVDLDRYIHGSDISGDIRSALTEIIVEGKSGPLMEQRYGANPPYWWKQKRDFWTPFVQLLDKGEINKLMEQEFRKRGIVFKRV